MTEPLARPDATSAPDGGAPDPCLPVRLVADDGAVLTFCAHGGHVLGWAPAGGQERLWLSRDTGCGPGTAVRGGIPVIWPQFAARGDGPRHGVVRDRSWEVLQAGTDDRGAATARLRLVSDGTTTPYPHAFTLHLDAFAVGAELSVRLWVRAEGTVPLVFTAALHTYLRVSSTADARLTGLEGRTAEANDGSGSTVLPQEPLTVVGPVDVAVAGVEPGTQGAVVLHDPVLGGVVLTADGFGSRVVWNPGPGSAPGDVHPGGEAEFVCVEPARLEPVTLSPGGEWTGCQVLRADAPA